MTRGIADEKAVLGDAGIEASAETVVPRLVADEDAVRVGAVPSGTAGAFGFCR